MIAYVDDNVVRNEDERYNAKLYASLIGPLLGVYYPLPTADENVGRKMLATSKLANLWCSVYDSAMTQALIVDHGGIRLPDFYAHRLDYDDYAVFGGKMTWREGDVVVTEAATDEG